MTTGRLGRSYRMVIRHASDPQLLRRWRTGFVLYTHLRRILLVSSQHVVLTIWTYAVITGTIILCPRGVSDAYYMCCLRPEKVRELVLWRTHSHALTTMSDMEAVSTRPGEVGMAKGHGIQLGLEA